MISKKKCELTFSRALCFRSKRKCAYILSATARIDMNVADLSDEGRSQVSVRDVIEILSADWAEPLIA